MKKTVGITIIAAIFAIGSAFAKQINAAKLWRLSTGIYVTLSAAEVKQIYCAGGDQVMCAVDADNAFNVIYKP